MISHGVLRFTRWVAGFSITTLILGPILALYAVQLQSSSPIDLSGILACAVLWLSNLISLVLNAVYWFIRRAPKWLWVSRPNWGSRLSQQNELKDCIPLDHPFALPLTSHLHAT